jgi:hypothetical protein
VQRVQNRTPTPGPVQGELACLLLFARTFEAIPEDRKLFRYCDACLGRNYHGRHPGMRRVR